MLNLNRISPTADFCSKIKQIDSNLNILMKNVLYITHMQDKILKLLNKITVDDKLQSQVDEFFEREETSPQTEFEDK